MPLFTDGNISNLEDLKSHDSEVLEVASTEGIDLSAKLRLAWEQVGLELEDFLRKRSWPPIIDTFQAPADLSGVVVTPALKQWHTLQALSLVYADAHTSRLNERHGRKWNEYRAQARQAADRLFRIGVGIASSPIPKAQAPEVRSVPSPVPEATYQVKVAWNNRQGQAGEASDAVIHRTAGGGLPAVRAIQPPANAVSYDVFVGHTDSEPAKQTTEALAPNQEWVLPLTGLVAGEPPPSGQAPDWHLRETRVLQRG